MGVLLVLLLACSLGLFAYPNFVHSRPRNLQAQYGLKQAFAAEKAYFATHDRYDESIEAVGFDLDGRSLYRFLFSKTGDSKPASDAPDGGPHTGLLADELNSTKPDNALLLRGIPAPLLSTVGIDGICPACDITIVAAGDIDWDSRIDVWSISTKDRTIHGEVVRAGVPYNDVRD